MTWQIAVGCLIGGVAVVLAFSAARVWRYCVSVWRVVASVQPRKRGAGARLPKQRDVVDHERLDDTD